MSSTDPEQIEKDIARHRAELGQTIDALSHRLDVKQQVKSQVERTRASVQGAADRAGNKVRALLASARSRLRNRRNRTLGERARMVGPVVVGVAAVVGIALVSRRRR